MARYTAIKRHPFKKAIALGIGLAIAFYLYNKVLTGNLLNDIMSLFESSVAVQSGGDAFTEAQRDSLVALASGFWTHHTVVDGRLVIDDRLEITPNGYIWQVAQMRFTLPSGAAKNITRVFHGFFYPSSRSVPDTTLVNVVIRSLQQMWIDERDTCVITRYVAGESRQENIAFDYGDLFVNDYVDNVTDVLLDSGTFVLDNREYALYEGDIRKIFPAGLIDRVYNLAAAREIKRDRQYSIQDGAVILTRDAPSAKVIEPETIQECAGSYSFGDVLRKAIGDDIRNNPPAERTRETISAIIRDYYAPFCLKERLTLAAGGRSGPLAIAISFDCTSEGKAANVVVQLQADVMERKWREKEAVLEIEKWRFPPLDTEVPLLKITFTGVL